MQAEITHKGITRTLDFEVLAPGIYVYHNAFPEEMNSIERIEKALSMPGTRFSWKQAGLGYGPTDLDSRKCQDFKIREDALLPKDEYSKDMIDLSNEIYDVIEFCLSHYKPLNFLGDIKYFECINIVRYGKGEYFKAHTDDGDPYRCTLSAVGYPNDNYAGGELTFPLFDVSYKPKAGDLLLNPSAYVYAHSADPVLDDGIKYSFVTMTDRNPFAHRADSPVYHSMEYRQQHGIL